jgi:hypothetical protein
LHIRILTAGGDLVTRTSPSGSTGGDLVTHTSLPICTAFNRADQIIGYALRNLQRKLTDLGVS